MSIEIIQSVGYDNYDDFQHVDFIFFQKFISLVRGLFNDKIGFLKHDILACVVET
jgi:hypothetical protein